MASGILGVGVTALNAAQAALRTTQHNIANANTPGYHRQWVEYAANPPNFSGAGFFGQGVSVTAVTRAYSRFLEDELMRSEAGLARHEVYARYATRIDRILGDAASGMHTAMQRFFASVQEVANAPTSHAAREVMLASGRGLASRFSQLATSLAAMQQAANDELSALASEANALVRQIADLNDRIAVYETTTGRQPNDLLDQRDQHTAELNKLVGVTVVRGADGRQDLYLGGALPLLIGNRPYALSATADPLDPRHRILALDTGSTVIALGREHLADSKAGGLLAVREDMLLPAQRELGHLAIALADHFNALHEGGYGLDTSTGNAFFSPANTLLRQPLAHEGNSGTAAVSVSLSAPGSSSQLTASDYLLTFNGGTSYTLTRLSDGASFSVTHGTPATIDGFNLLTSGTPAVGDRWLIRVGTEAAGKIEAVLTDARKIAAASSAVGLPGDNSNALAMAALQTSPVLENGTMSLANHYARLVTRMASLAREADHSVQAYSTLQRQALEAQQAFSGVNLDEEAANLMRFQQAYQAAARALQVANTLFEELLAITR
ncbi:MAG: flagellar hook-associated protein FlgK [Thiobacillaceae bacterium]|nr:flagellar hook-associated protein FlgK [Thiobacillaceae bacterium]